MFWKNLVIISVFGWLAASQAADPVVAEDMDDAFQHKYESPYKAKDQKRGLANQADKPEPTAEEGADVKYWRWEQESDLSSKD